MVIYIKLISLPLSATTTLMLPQPSEALLGNSTLVGSCIGNKYYTMLEFVDSENCISLQQ